MNSTFSALREKEVINICDGKRLGYICDLSIETENGSICSIFVSDGFLGLSDRKRYLKIDWCRIKCIGDDTILLDLPEHNDCEREEKCGREEKKKFPRLFW